MNGFSFCITNKESNQVLELSNFTSEQKFTTPQNQLIFFANTFEKIEVLNTTKFESITVIHSNKLSTLVPKALFSEDNLSSYLKNNIKVLENDFITFDEINNFELVNIYIPSVLINNFIFDKFGSFEFKHSTTVLVENILNIFKNSNEINFFVNVEEDLFQIVITENNKLLFLNSYKYNSKEDFIYHILFAAEQLKLNPETFNLSLTGNIKEDSELFKFLYKYIRNIKFHEPEYQISSELNFDKHAFFTLINN